MIQSEQIPSRAETIVFNGIPFRRYPQSRHSNHRKYYSPSGKYIKQGIKNLHVEIWKSHHGPVPTGHEIHHRDRDPLNNAIDNLQCLSATEHSEEHRREGRVRAAIAFKYSGRQKLLQAGAANWHGSEEGRRWHSEHGKQVWSNRRAIEYVCEQCHQSFESLKASRVRFCSKRCKAQARRDSGIDDIERTCRCCGEPFMSNKFDGAEFFCSRRCSSTAVPRGFVSTSR